QTLVVLDRGGILDPENHTDPARGASFPDLRDTADDACRSGKPRDGLPNVKDAANKAAKIFEYSDGRVNSGQAAVAQTLQLPFIQHGDEKAVEDHLISKQSSYFSQLHLPPRLHPDRPAVVTEWDGSPKRSPVNDRPSPNGPVVT